jgi:hypothetical protein
MGQLVGCKHTQEAKFEDRVVHSTNKTLYGKAVVEKSGELGSGEHKVRCKRALEEYSRPSVVQSADKESPSTAVVELS